MPDSPIITGDPSRRVTQLGPMLEPVLRDRALSLGFRGIRVLLSARGREEMVVTVPGDS